MCCDQRIAQHAHRLQTKFTDREDIPNLRTVRIRSPDGRDKRRRSGNGDDRRRGKWEGDRAAALAAEDMSKHIQEGIARDDASDMAGRHILQPQMVFSV